MKRRRWPRFAVILEAVPPRLREGMATPVPAIVTLRRALKVLGRGFGLKCRWIRELPEDAPDVVPDVVLPADVDDEG
jgi:hypothetical protein